MNGIKQYTHGVGNMALVRVSAKGIAAYNAGHQAGVSRNFNIDRHARDGERRVNGAMMIVQRAFDV